VIKYQVVCFCDIPDTDLAIHVRKYSRFGLAFKKDFLIERGACPVFYVANESPVSTNRVFSPDDFLARIKAASAKGYVDRALYFDTSIRAILDLLAALDGLCCEEGERYFKGFPASEFKQRFAQLMGLSAEQVSAVEAALKGNSQSLSTVRMCTDFLLNYVFTFMKCFDAKSGLSTTMPTITWNVNGGSARTCNSHWPTSHASSSPRAMQRDSEQTWHRMLARSLLSTELFVGFGRVRRVLEGLGLTVFFCQADDAFFAAHSKNRPIDTNSRRNRADPESANFSFIFKSANF
jgi:hypothetical protein